MAIIAKELIASAQLTNASALQQQLRHKLT